MDINISTYTGNVTADIKANTSKDGKHTYANFQLVCDYFQNGKQKPIFIPCTLFGKTAKLASEYVHKGDKIAVSGYTRPDNYQTKHGDNVQSLELIVTNCLWSINKNKNKTASKHVAKTGNSSNNHKSSKKSIDIKMKDIPF